jgi:RNA polymerase sigma-70 factor (ECF subfamily)
MTKVSYISIFNEHNRSLIGYARKLVGEVYAEDIVEEAFLKLWENKSNGDPLAYLKTIIKTKAIDIYRHKKTVSGVHREIKYLSEDFIAAKEVESDLIDLIVKEIESLPTQQKKVAKLLSFGYSRSEISSMLKISPNTVGVTIMEVRRKLKPKFSQNRL